MFYPLLFLVLSGVPLETAANFLLFLNVAKNSGKVLSAVKNEFDLYFLLTVSIFSYYEGKKFQINTNSQVVIFIEWYKTERLQFI